MPRSVVPSGNGLANVRARSQVAVCSWFGYGRKRGSTLSSAGHDSSSRAASEDTAAGDEHRGGSPARRRLCEYAGNARCCSKSTTRSHAEIGRTADHREDPSVKEVSVRVGSSHDILLVGLAFLCATGVELETTRQVEHDGRGFASIMVHTAVCSAVGHRRFTVPRGWIVIALSRPSLKIKIERPKNQRRNLPITCRSDGPHDVSPHQQQLWLVGAQ